MMNVESYHQYAVDCVRKAQREEAPGDRDILLNVALAWVRLAQQTETLGATPADSQRDDETDANPMDEDDVR
jgi:hypothetical protein